jgi:hydroxymethylbilane synthase
MTDVPSLVIGTRGSTLALAQTQLVIDALKQHYPEVEIRSKIIVTKGDLNQSPIPLDTIGKSWFTAEIEDALLKGEIDIAAHSMKDLPPEIPEGIITMPVLKRGDPRDVLISKSGASFNELPKGTIIGTDSIRRKVLLLDQRPDLVVKSIRGNVDTRIKKLHDEPYDAIILAAAGLERVGMIGLVTEFLDPLIIIPAIGQGILAAQARQDRNEVIDMLRAIQDVPTHIAADAEQAFSNTIGGGCKVPIGCYAHIVDDTIIVDAFMQSADGTHLIRKSATSPISTAADTARALARELLA